MNNIEEEKKIDNKITVNDYVSSYKEKINDINNQIDEEKNKMKNLNDMEDIVVSLNKSVETCVGLLRESMQGNNINNKLDSIEESNTINLNKVIGNIDIKRDDVKNNLFKLNNDKDNIEEEFRKNSNNITKEGE